MHTDTMIAKLIYYHEQLSYWKNERSQAGSNPPRRILWNLYKYQTLSQTTYTILKSQIDTIIPDHELYESIYD